MPEHDSKDEEMDFTPGKPPRDWREDLGRKFPPPPFPVAGVFPQSNVVPPPVRLHPSTYEYLRPSEEQLELMSRLRQAARTFSEVLENLLPDGPDKTFVLRAHRANAMWANVAITRLADGTPRP
jgi:hypothetical protein